MKFLKKVFRFIFPENKWKRDPNHMNIEYFVVRTFDIGEVRSTGHGAYLHITDKEEYLRRLMKRQGQILEDLGLEKVEK